MALHCPLLELSTELLLKIFSDLELHDLCHLRQTCKRFNDVISSWAHTLVKRTPLVTNQKRELFLNRCMQRLSTLEKIRISRNWISGRYLERSLLPSREKFIPWLQIDDQNLWLSRGKQILGYRRSNKGISVDSRYTLLGNSKEDIVNFQIKGGLLVSGLREGGIWLRSLFAGRSGFDMNNCHNSDVKSVDISIDGSIIVSGSRDHVLKIWKLKNEADKPLEEIHCSAYDDTILKVSLSDEQPLLAVGTSGNQTKQSILIYDIESLSNPLKLSSSRLGQGILDLRWDGIYSLWSCGYDGLLKRWDLRTGRCEQNYPDPYQSSLYCLDYDYHNTIMTGTQMHGRVVLWDIRHTKFVQIYFMESCKSRRYPRSSPIYSLGFDSQFLFTATDRNLNVLDFTKYDGEPKDYSFWKSFR